jgi:hypothetical protein
MTIPSNFGEGVDVPTEIKLYKRSQEEREQWYFDKVKDGSIDFISFRIYLATERDRDEQRGREQGYSNALNDIIETANECSGDIECFKEALLKRIALKK